MPCRTRVSDTAMDKTDIATARFHVSLKSLTLLDRQSGKNMKISIRNVMGPIAAHKSKMNVNRFVSKLKVVQFWLDLLSGKK